MELRLEVVIIAVSDVDRSLAFYRDKLRFRLDVDYRPNDAFRVVQLTPSGSSCSVQFGVGVTDARPGQAQGLYLVVDDIDKAIKQFGAQGVILESVRHKAAVDWQGDFLPGLAPDRRDYATLADVVDPDGNRWTLQERGYRAPS